MQNIEDDFTVDIQRKEINLDHRELQDLLLVSDRSFIQSDVNLLFGQSTS